ncbi:folylpolyglutamate synthase, mitochondrial-like isoform X1 [Haemaphysalis longicornis]
MRATCFARQNGVSENFKPKFSLVDCQLNLARYATIEKPTVLETVGEVPDSTMTTPPRRGYEDAVHALNSLQSKREEAFRTSLGRPVPDFLCSWQMPQHLKAVGVEVSDIDSLNVIHVAGTKGKGSTCAFAESVLRRQGFRTGLYTSPHLVAVRERIRINGMPLSEEAFAKYFWDVYDNLEAKEGEDMPGYFRFMTVMAFKVFIEENVDVLVLEVGLGGESCSTNVVRQPSVVGITSLGLDHTSVLGSSLQEIAWHKAGILKKGCPAFTLPQPEKALGVLVERALEKGCSIRLVPPLSTYEWDVPPCRLGISGREQQGNASLALQLCRAWLAKHSPEALAGSVKQSAEEVTEQAWLGLNNLPVIAPSFQISKTMAEGLEQCRWPGRCQAVPCGRGLTLYLDGAHTEESLQCCIRWWREASAAEQHSLGAEVKVRRMLLFNCRGDRRPEVLLSLLAGEPFDVALFSPNRLGITNNPHADQTDIPVDKLAERAKCEANMHAWCHLVSNQREEGLFDGGSAPTFAGNCSDGSAETTCLVFPCLSEAVTWIQEQQNCAKQSTPPVHIQVLATGSLLLVGGVMSLVNPDLALRA